MFSYMYIYLQVLDAKFHLQKTPASIYYYFNYVLLIQRQTKKSEQGVTEKGAQ